MVTSPDTSSSDPVSSDPGSSDPWSYANWDALLAEVVSAEGKIDYAILRGARSRLDAFRDDLAARSPVSHPASFPTRDDQLAYWINAYNAFTLAAIVDEYPITSVWKTRDGQFFQRPRHVAGGVELSLDDIEHRILRSDFAEPRIHFAINCGSNGCPPVRPSAYRAEGVADTLAEATRTFLANPANCRVDQDQGRIFVSRLFKMYAGDFAGESGTREDYRQGVLRFIAEHSDLELAAIEGYQVVYNIYDWGLNDTHREPQIGPIVFHESVEHFAPADAELRELYLYEGNFCNRACSWCTVDGSPQGWYQPYSSHVLDQALASVAVDGNLKFYGGEPTLHPAELLKAIRYLREAGFEGLITLYSNGVRAEQLIQLLESDAGVEAVLNYSIFHGRDAEPIPARARERLERWAQANPHRLFKGNKVLFHAGNASEQEVDQDREAEFHGLGTGCVRCFPVLRSDGQLRACPFAAELDAEHHNLGQVGDDPADLRHDYEQFLGWVDSTLDPAARERGITSCEMCHQHIAELEPPRYRRELASPSVPLRNG